MTVGAHMTVLTAIVVVFMLLELANVGSLYFVPGSTKFNALGVFAAWESSKNDPQVHGLVRYLACWVAGTKLIFLGLLAVVLTLGPPRLVMASVAVLIATILTFYWRLFPLIRRMDADGQLTVPGYSKVLGVMIALFVVALGVGLAFGLRSYPG